MNLELSTWENEGGAIPVDKARRHQEEGPSELRPWEEGSREAETSAAPLSSIDLNRSDDIT